MGSFLNDVTGPCGLALYVAEKSPMERAGEVRVSPGEVHAAWENSDQGKANTLGIFDAMSEVVTAWWRMPLTLNVLGELRVIGGDPDEPWAKRSKGTFKVAACENEKPPGGGPLAKVVLVAVREDQQGRAVLIDGNKRAVALSHGLEAGRPIPEGSVLYVGDLHPAFRFIAKAVSSLWR